MGQRAQTNTFELKAHRKHEIRHQHRHLERDELTPAQSAWPERLVAIPGPSLCTNQGRGGNQVRDILIGRPVLPKCRSPSATAICVGRRQGNGLADAWAASPGLVMPFDQVVVDMENVRDP